MLSQITLTVLHSTEYWLHCWTSFIASLCFKSADFSNRLLTIYWKKGAWKQYSEGTPGQRACSFAHAPSGSLIWRPFWKCPTVSNLLLWKFGDRSLCFLIASQDIVRLLQMITALSALSNQSLLKCEATLSGRDTQSEIETETSREVWGESINTGMFTTQTKTVLLRLFDTQDFAEKSR